MDHVKLVFSVLCMLFLAGCSASQPAAETAAPAAPAVPEPAQAPAAEPTPAAPEPEPVAVPEPVNPPPAEEPEQEPAAPQPAAPSYSYSDCNYITPSEIEGVIGTSYMTGPISATDPAGCSVMFLAADTKSNFFFTLRDYGQSAAAASRMKDSDCKSLGTYLQGEIKDEIGETSCRRTTKTASTQLDIMFVKDGKLVQVGSNKAGVTFDQLMRLANVVEPRIS